MRNLVIGASGQVGKALLETLHKKNEEIIGTFNKTQFNSSLITNDILPGKLVKLDLLDKINTEKLIADINPDIIYLPAAETNVDYCEQHPETAEINCTPIYNIIDSINNISIKLNRKRKPLIIFYSTDYVFDGENGPYKETDFPCPINVYGEQKLRAEICLSRLYEHYIIIRTSGVFGSEIKNKNFVNRLVQSLREGKEIILPDDEFLSPTFSLDLADATLKIINNIGLSLRNYTDNIVNICGGEIISKYDFAVNIAKTFYVPANLKRIKSRDIVRPAKRPLLGGLNVEKVEMLIGRKMMHYRDCLETMHKNLV